jgi:hypothetical protein
VCKVPFCHTQYNKKAVFLEFYCLLSIYFWGRVFDNLGGAGEQIKILGHLFTPGIDRITSEILSNCLNSLLSCVGWILGSKTYQL